MSRLCRLLRKLNYELDYADVKVGCISMASTDERPTLSAALCMCCMSGAEDWAS